MIIEIEGIDGVGKTTQATLLKKFLEEKGFCAIVVKDLESTELGLKVRELLISNIPRAKSVELFGFLFCKALLFSEVIEKALDQGSWVICDRGFGSLISYFEANGFERNQIQDMLNIAVPELKPSYTFFLELSVKEAMRRNLTKSSFSKFDNMGAAFFIKQAAIYRKLSEQKNWCTIDAAKSVIETHQEIVKLLEIKT